MSVDVATYISNIYAESIKSSVFRRQEMLMITEVWVPTFSVVSMLAVTVYISIDAVLRITHPPKINDVNVNYMYAFSSVNLGIDVFCSGMFLIKGKDAFYEPKAPIPLISLDTNIDDSDSEFGHLEEDLDEDYYKQTQLSEANSKKNLNMISAFTHVGGDTIRTISMLTAATVSSSAHVDADICDAWAAVVVSVTIMALLIPLAIDIGIAARDIQAANEGVSYNPVSSSDNDQINNNISEDLAL
jgi:Co/Zn/Cd efflux system component